MDDCNECRNWAEPTVDVFGQTQYPGAPHEGDEYSTSFSQNQKQETAYFHAWLPKCQSCGSLWLSGYYEDYSDAPVDAEFGRRYWIMRPISSERVAEIKAAAGKHSLDIDTFGL